MYSIYLSPFKCTLPVSALTDAKSPRTTYVKVRTLCANPSSAPIILCIPTQQPLIMDTSHSFHTAVSGIHYTALCS